MNVATNFLSWTKVRDKLVFFLYALLIVVLFSWTVWEGTDSSRSVTLYLLLFLQFYLSAFFQIPFSNYALRQFAYVAFFGINFFFLRELVWALAPFELLVKPGFDWMLGVLFALTLVGRNIRMYVLLIDNLERLNELRLYNQLFKKPEKLQLKMGKAGEMQVHPNEIVYVRTKASGDHTKVFGIRKKKKDGRSKMKEYETLAYRNFDEVLKVLAPYPQLKRVSQSTILNLQYPHQEKDGVITIESRRFSISNHFKA